MGKMKIYIFALLFSLLNACGYSGLKIRNHEVIRIIQRDSQVIKGSEGDIEIYVGDISLGMATVQIRSTNDNKLYLKEEMRKGDEAIFQYSETHIYKIKIKRYEEHFFHDDIAFVIISEVSPPK
ncbi:MAG: hypothetical protein IAE67_05205 [Candidatus Competibacteraceae bacterium]|nr:hypothetical protein [Candidatus Competibacteraceae bacterium]